MILSFISREKIVAARCTDCGELYMYDSERGNNCPRCNSSRRNYPR